MSAPSTPAIDEGPLSKLEPSPSITSEIATINIRRHVGALTSLLNALDASVRPGDPPHGLAKLVDFLRPRPSDITRALLDEPAPKTDAGRFRLAFEHTAGAVERTEALILVLESEGALARRLTLHVCASVRGRRLRELLSEQGIPEQESLIGGTLRRLRDRLLPPLPERASWLDLFSELFSSPRDGTWVAAVPLDLWRRLYCVITSQLGSGDGSDSADTGNDDATTMSAGRTQLAFESRAAVAMVSHRLAALGVDPVLRRYYAPAAQNESPFLEQAHELSSWSPGATPDEAGLIKHALVLLDQCTQILRQVRKLASTQGTTTQLTTTVLRGKALVRRLELLLALHHPTVDAGAHWAFADLFVDLVDGESNSRSVGRFVQETTDLVALQITEHAARTGDHYVTQTRSEYWAMARSAAGAGGIISVMALVKLLISGLDLPVFWNAFLSGLNYAAGFVLIHVLHMTVATKQPAMTAAKIAATLEPVKQGRPGSSGARLRTTPLSGVVTLIASISRTQLVAIAGNVLVAVPGSFVVAALCQYALGVTIVDAEKANYLLESVHPFQSLALAYAALAGICLFLAGIVSGYVDNLCLVSRFPERLRRSAWLGRALGDERRESIADYMTSNLGAVVGNAAFGFMLAYVGFFGEILGLPLDIRHVTFSSAYVAWGALGLGGDVDAWLLVGAVVGVALIALCNLAVSFALALHVAMRARGAGVAAALRIAGALRDHLRTNGRDFIWPPPDPGPPPDAPPNPPPIV
ncbi:MAG: site-specific recombinase [Myxococcales bacterium]|nr:site-specific recombinase [Myxococcales bacterium]